MNSPDFLIDPLQYSFDAVESETPASSFAEGLDNYILSKYPDATPAELVFYRIKEKTNYNNELFEVNKKTFENEWDVNVSFDGISNSQMNENVFNLKTPTDDEMFSKDESGDFILIDPDGSGPEPLQKDPIFFEYTEIADGSGLYE